MARMKIISKMEKNHAREVDCEGKKENPENQFFVVHTNKYIKVAIKMLKNIGEDDMDMW